MQFSPCQGGDNCTQDGTHCQGCGRSHEEIAQTRALVKSIAEFAVQMGYDNVEDFANYVRDKSVGTVMKIKAEQSGLGISIK